MSDEKQGINPDELGITAPQDALPIDEVKKGNGEIEIEPHPWDKGEIGGLSVANEAGRYAHNEDHICAGEFPGGCWAVLCDGAGGHARGDKASLFVGEKIGAKLEDTLKRPFPRNVEILIKDMLVDADEALSLEDGEASTTAVIAIVHGGHLYVAHAGDSRLMTVLNGEGTRETQDHSNMSLYMNSGMSREIAKTMPGAQSMYLGLGRGELDVYKDKIGYKKIRLFPGQKAVLYSDGLNVLADEEIASIVQENGSAAGKGLVEAAIAAKSNDNISALAITYNG